MKKGLLITNGFLRTDKFTEHYDCLKQAAEKYHITLDLWENADLLAGYGVSECFGESICERLKEYQFVIFWDKDVRMGKVLSELCKGLGIPVYNSVEAIAACDDKSETYRILQLWNEQDIHANEQIPILPTIVAPMTYAGIGYTNLDFLQEITHRLQFPMVIKECFGSFGGQVYLVQNEEELRDWTMKLAGIPFLYQKYLRESHGHDVRLQVVGDQVVAGMHRFSLNGDFRANLTNGGQMESYMPSEKECSLAVRTVQALGLDFAGVDLLFSDGPDGEADVVCEVNSNAHFRNIAECTGVNVAEKIMEYIAGK